VSEETDINSIELTVVKPQEVGIEVEDEPAKIPFRQNYKSAGFFSQIFYSYSWPLISSIEKNDLKMTEDMIEDMNKKEG